MLSPTGNICCAVYDREQAECGAVAANNGMGGHCHICADCVPHGITFRIGKGEGYQVGNAYQRSRKPQSWPVSHEGLSHGCRDRADLRSPRGAACNGEYRTAHVGRLPGAA